MEFLLYIILGIIVLNIAAAMAENVKPNKQDMLRKLGYCPPHKWKFIDVKNENDEVIATTIVCELCGPIKPMDTPDRMDY